MFNSEFFPTPTHAIAKMLEGVELANKSILEPSAGKGDILDYLKESYRYRYSEKNLYCIEKEPELKHILQSKGYRVIGEDFLKYSGDHLFDVILMNPPFSNGDEHLLKAWEIMEEGEVICLLNYETINNPYTSRRKLLADIIAKYGTVENIGAAFRTAERSTGVEIGLVRLKKKSTGKRLDFEFKNVTSDIKHELNEDTFQSEIATRDVIGNMMLQFVELKKHYINYLQAIAGMKFYSQGLLRNERDKIVDIAQQSLTTSKNASFNNFNDAVKQEIWSVVLTKTNVERYMTAQVRENFHKFSQAQGFMDFTKENVASLVEMIYGNRENIMEQAVVAVFDYFTKYHKENREHIEGWKTNDKFKVNKKVILPNVIGMNYSGNYEVSWYNKTREDFRDIDKVMCYITGINYESMKSVEDTIRTIKIGTTEKTECEFFYIRCYKKGTVHLEFKDKYLHQEFNMRACAGKNWLPEQDKKAWQKQKEKAQTPQYKKIAL